MTKEKTLNDYTPEEIEKARHTILRRNNYYQEHKEEKATYNQEHKEEIREQHQQYYQDNKKEMLEHDHQYYQEHKSEKTEHQHQYDQEHRNEKQQYHREHKDEKREYDRQWRETHPEASKILHQNNAAKRKNVEGTFSLEEWTHKLEEYDNKCAYCNTKTEDTPERFLTVDHATPLTRGGTNYIDNLVPACFQCNMKKSTMTSKEFFEGIDADKEEGVLVRRYISEHLEEAVQLFEKYKIGFQEEVQSNDSQEK